VKRRGEGRGGIFVAGTDTGVGKTTVAELLLHAARSRGWPVTARKPYASGSRSDSRRLRRAAASRDPLDAVTPVFCRRPLAPAVELARGLSPWAKAAKACREGRGTFRVVEGIGGVLTPLDRRRSAADLCRAAGLPVWLVARPGLGTLNHVLLSLEALRRRGVRTERVVLSRWSGRDAAERTNPALLRRLTGLPVTLLPALGSARARAAAARRWAALLAP
jgi:dethiobiotin synthetase